MLLLMLGLQSTGSFTAAEVDITKSAPLEGTYPPELLRWGIGGAQRLAVVVSPEGKPVDCVVTQIIGPKELGSIACEAALKAVRYRPARDSSGAAVYGIESRGSSFVAMPAKERPRLPVDLVLEVNRLPPPETTKPFRVDQFVESDGHTASCQADVPSSLKSLSDLVCRAVGEPPEVMRTAVAGKRAVISRMVAFELKSPAP